MSCRPGRSLKWCHLGNHDRDIEKAKAIARELKEA
jgi:hypothetical protein